MFEQKKKTWQVILDNLEMRYDLKEHRFDGDISRMVRIMERMHERIVELENLVKFYHPEEED